MDQMIEQIIEYSAKYKSYSADEIEKIAGYLVGKNKFENVIPILAQPKESWYNHQYVHAAEIAKGIKDDFSLFSRLGRHLKLIEYMNVNMYANFIHHIINNGISVADIFIRGGLGEENLLAFATTGNYYRINLKDVLERVCASRPEAIVNFLERKELQTYQRFPVSAFWLSRTGYGNTKQSVFMKIMRSLSNGLNFPDIESQFNSDVAASVMVNIWQNHAEKLGEYLGNLDDGEQEYFSQVKSYNDISGQNNEQMENISNNLFRAFVFSDYKSTLSIKECRFFAQPVTAVL